jgi:hypothetical protein
VRDTAKVDNGPEAQPATDQAVVGGFGVSAATRRTAASPSTTGPTSAGGTATGGREWPGWCSSARSAPATLCAAIAVIAAGEDVSLGLTLPGWP